MAQAIDARATRILPPGSQRTFVQANGGRSWFWGHASAQPHADWYAGWTVGRHRILSDWRLLVNGREPDRSQALVFVMDAATIRVWESAGIIEQLEMVPGEDAFQLRLTAPEGSTISVEPVGLEPVEGASRHLFRARDAAGGFVRRDIGVIEATGAIVARFTCSQSLAALAEPAPLLDLEKPTLDLIEPLSSIWGTNPAALALNWLQVTGGQLVARQSGVGEGRGIWAGLPWFDDFWGRDTFISFIGLLLVPGRFADARAVLVDFADLQDKDPASPTVGRVPNRARPDDIIYNTADGTPRFVASIADYLDYSGDTSVIGELWPAVKRALDGALAHNVDSDGLMIHADADTWMDAKEAGTRPFTPRGNRANDIQALWHRQLLVTARLAEAMGEAALASDCRARAAQVEASFQRLFLNPAIGTMADRLRPDGSPDMSMRPNRLFALDLVNDPELRTRLVRQAFEALVLPWGTMSLAPDDPGFHPVHEAPELWHKDFAYHTGTVWLWLNGIVIQRLLERGMIAPAWQLMDRMLRQAQEEGTVGCLTELRDAMPRGGATEGRLSGTFLQAWSNAEHIRVWREWFVGLRPTAQPGQLVLDPNLPREAAGWSDTARFGAATLVLEQSGDAPDRLRVRLVSDTAVILLCRNRRGALEPRQLQPGETITIAAHSPLARSGGDRALSGLSFAQARPAESFPVWQAAEARRRGG